MFSRKTPKDGKWHEHVPWFFVRLNDGRLSRAFGRVWRRWNGNSWEYRQSPETEDDNDARQY